MPEIVVVDASLVAHAAVMDEPGAWMLTHIPWFENLRARVRVALNVSLGCSNAGYT